MIIVVAESNDQVRGFLMRCLAAAGHEVIPASTGQEAWAQVQSNRPAIFLTELRLRGMGGDTVIERCHRQYPTTRIVVMAQDGRPETAAATYRLGASNFVRKPFAIDEIEAIIESHALVLSREAVVSCGPLTVDALNKQAWFDGQELEIVDDLDFGVLSLLVRSQGQVVPRDIIVRHVWGIRKMDNPLELDRRISKLINQMKAAGAAHKFIYLIPDMAGYTLTETSPLRGLLGVGKGKAIVKKREKKRETKSEKTKRS